jgi:hypothetical protein
VAEFPNLEIGELSVHVKRSKTRSERHSYFGHSSSAMTQTTTELLTARCLIGPSLIPDAGYGVFAQQDIKKGALITSYEGIVLLFHEVLKLPEGSESHVRALESQHTYIDGFKGEYFASFDTPLWYGLGSVANDARDPSKNNAQYWRRWNEKRATYEMYLKALRDIKEGEEIYVSYGDAYWLKSPYCYY